MKKVKVVKPTPDDATWHDHQQLVFWLKACLEDGHTYLESSFKINKHYRDDLSYDVETRRKYRIEHQELSDKRTLNAYHFTAVTGNLIRLLERAQYLFPALKKSYSRAKHLCSEGKELRDMVEHSHGIDGYLAGYGNKPDRFSRADANSLGIPLDAISLLINKEGHWLGGRLCVETVLREVFEIYEDAIKITFPMSSHAEKDV